MARRESDSGGLNLDSLMDTLTNVVGILLIILIFTVVSGADAVKRIKGFVDEISEAQLKEAIAQSEEMKRLLEQHQQALEAEENEAPKRKTTLDRHPEILRQLKSDMEKLASAKVNVEELKKQLEQRRTQVGKLEQSIGDKQKEIASLQARLSVTPARGPDADAKIVNLPEPREAPAGAQPLVFLCRKGRVAPVDSRALQVKAMGAVQAAARMVVRQDRLDCEKLAGIFEKRFIGDRYCQVKVRTGGDARPYLAVEIREDAGDKTENIGKRNSQFRRWIYGIDPGKYYLEFRVASDSFDTYLEARNVAARQGLLAGWVPFPANGEYLIGFGAELKTTCLGKEPPKPAPPMPGAKNQPPPPADVVD